MERDQTRRRTRGRYTVAVRGTGGGSRAEVLAELLWRKLRGRR